MVAAQRTIGIFASSIGNRAAGNGKTAGGYIWPSGPPYKGLKPAAMVRVLTKHSPHLKFNSHIF